METCLKVAGESWGGLGRTGEDWGVLGRTGEVWGELQRAGDSWQELGRRRRRRRRRTRDCPGAEQRPPMSVLIARHKRLPILQKCFSTKTTSMKQEHEEGEEEEQETALEQSKDPL